MTPRPRLTVTHHDPPLLTRAVLDSTPSGQLCRPAYDLDSTIVTHAHIGPGVFHRGHQAIYSDDLLAAGYNTSAICAISMRSSTLSDLLGQQDMLYSVIGSEERIRVVGSIRQSLVATSDIRAAIERLADPAIRVVTMTVTEPGYCWSTSTGSLDTNDPSIVHDVANPEQPTSMPGLLVAALALRRSRGTSSFTVIPCDNLTANGALTRTVLHQLAGLVNPDLASYIQHEVPVCSTMVDRMVPSTTPEDRFEVQNVAGITDQWPVRTERYSEWVIERAPGAFLPPWAEVGVEVTDDVAAHEQMKLHVLNASHSAIAYIGLHRGHRLISDALLDNVVKERVAALLADEIAGVTMAPGSVSVQRYAATCLERFGDDSLGYTTLKVASGGGQKIQQRILPTVERLLTNSQSIDGLALVIAMWFWCIFGPEADTLGLSDPWFEQSIAPRLSFDGNPHTVATRLLAEPMLFGALATSQPFAQAVLGHIVAVWGTPRPKTKESLT